MTHTAHSTRAPRFLPSGLWVMWVMQNEIGNGLFFALPTLPTVLGMWFRGRAQWPRVALPTLPTGKRPFCCTAQF